MGRSGRSPPGARKSVCSPSSHSSLLRWGRGQVKRAGFHSGSQNQLQVKRHFCGAVPFGTRCFARLCLNEQSWSPSSKAQQHFKLKTKPTELSHCRTVHDFNENEENTVILSSPSVAIVVTCLSYSEADTSLLICCKTPNEAPR